MAKTIDFYALELKYIANGNDVTTLTPIGSFTHDVEKIERFIENIILPGTEVDYNIYEIDYESLMAICNEPTKELFLEECCKEAHAILREVNGDSPDWCPKTRFYFHIVS